MKRGAVVAGQFYKGSAIRLDSEVKSLVSETLPKEKVKGIIAPHAGFMYSGKVAGSVYSSIRFPKTFILIGPNHRGTGSNISIMSEGIWEIPTGEVNIDERLGGLIKRSVPIVTEDARGHAYEHSLEVQVPFIRYFSDSVKIVPLIIKSAGLDELKALGEGIASSVIEAGYDVIIAASSDMSHYISDGLARKKDRLAIDRIIALDPEGLYNTVLAERISMCGFMPAVSMLFACLALGATEARLVDYDTSGTASRDFDSVVGYAGMVVK